jgi:hypothetical protein
LYSSGFELGGVFVGSPLHLFWADREKSLEQSDRFLFHAIGQPVKSTHAGALAVRASKDDRRAKRPISKVIVKKK